MADLFLHLPFARRLRYADGLHPLVGEALVRRPALVCLGASLAHLPQNERKGMSFLRRLFSRGGEAARWQKAFAGPARVDLIASVLQKGETPSPAGGGSMMRFATALGLLAHDVLEDTVGGLTSSLPPHERPGVERAQARLWLQAVVPNQKDLEREWRVVMELGEGELQKNAIAHLDKAIQRVHGGSPGEAVLTRWVKGLASDAAPLADPSKSQGLPASLGTSDVAARAQHFEGNHFVEKAQTAVARFVFLANRLAERMSPEVDKDAVVEALSKDGKLLEAPTSVAEHEAAKARWTEWLGTTRRMALERGRNPKPAYGEGGEPLLEAPRPGATGVMRLSDLPPETDVPGAPPVPEVSQPNMATPPLPPTTTQEVSMEQIQAEAAAHAAATGPQQKQQDATKLDDAAGEFQVPAHTQEVSLAQIEDATAPPPNVTQPVVTADIVAESPRDPPAPPAAAPPDTAPPPGEEAAAAAPTSAHTEAAANDEPHPKANGKAEEPATSLPPGEKAPDAPPPSGQPADPPRE